jgi:hypothetical protein
MDEIGNELEVAVGTETSQVIRPSEPIHNIVHRRHHGQRYRSYTYELRPMRLTKVESSNVDVQGQMNRVLEVTLILTRRCQD